MHTLRLKLNVDDNTAAVLEKISYFSAYQQSDTQESQNDAFKT